MTTPVRLILIVRLFATAKTSPTCFCDRLRLSRSTVHKMVTLSFKAYVQLPCIFDCSVRRLNMVEKPRSPPHIRFCDCSRSLRLVVQSLRLPAIIACNWSYTGRKLVVSDRKPRETGPYTHISLCSKIEIRAKVSISTMGNFTFIHNVRVANFSIQTSAKCEF